MPRGFSGVRKASAQAAANRKASSNFVPAFYFKLGDGETAKVRFLEEGEDIAWCWTHEIPVQGRAYGNPTPCLDQEDEDEPCPGCEAEMARKFKGYINMIWYDAPLYKRNAEGRLVKDSDGDKIEIGNEDQVAVWSSGPQLFEQLEEVDTKFKGLCSRPWDIKRKGLKLKTTYSVTPNDPDAGRDPDLTKAEKKLAEGKTDLNLFTKPESYEDFEAMLRGEAPKSKDDDDEKAKGPKKSANPFMNRSNK